MAEVNGLDFAGRRRRRGVVKASITKMGERVRELEERIELTHTDRLTAERLQHRLINLDSDFRTYHLGVVDLLEDETELATEQAALDDHDDKVTGLFNRLAILTTPVTREAKADPQQLLLKRLQYIERNLRQVDAEVSTAAERPDVDRCLLEQYDEQINGFKFELFDVSRSVLSLNEDTSGLTEHEARLSKVVFNTRLRIRRLLQAPPPVVFREGIKLPKIDVPRFDGDIMNWNSFWEQYEVSIHSREQLSDPEKLAYLRQSLKDGPAKRVIEGLSGSGSDYAEAIECLKKRYDKPRVLHQAHVRAITEAQVLKDGSGKELRRLHDICSQHLRALKAMKYEPSGAFVTALLEMKLDQSTMFEWQRHTQEQSEVPHFTEFLEFIDLRARASEATVREGQRRQSQTVPSKGNVPTRITYAANIDINTSCVVCEAGKHPLYACRKFRSLTTEERMDVVRKNQLCYNCLQSGHFKPQCKSDQKCLKCRKSHHTLLHSQYDHDNEARMSNEAGRDKKRSTSAGRDSSSTSHSSHISHPVPGGHRSALLMTCQVAIMTSDGYVTTARALLDCASSASFVTERLVQRMRLPRKHQRIQVDGIGGKNHGLLSHSVVTFNVASLRSMDVNKRSWPRWKVEAVVLPKITTELPASPVSSNEDWKHLKGLRLADPDYGVPGYIDILLGIDVYNKVVCQGRRTGPPGSPVALNTRFGWVLSGTVKHKSPQQQVTSYLSSVIGDEILQKFWEVENCDFRSPPLSLEEQAVVDHFNNNHRRDKEGRFIVPLPMKADAEELGETKSMAMRRFRSLERSLRSRGNSDSFAEVIDEYFELGHAEPVPPEDLDKHSSKVYYMPMHAVYKDSSTTTKLRVVFDASAKSSSGVSLNDQLLVGPTMHAPLIDVLLRFRRYQIAITTDISKMYRAVLLPKSQRDLHRFVWRRNEHDALKDYRMTRLTFGVSASSFAANMAVRQNAILNEKSHPRAARAVHESFYVDDGLTGAASVTEAVNLQSELQELFKKAGFTLRKWKSNEPAALRHLPSHLVDQSSSRQLPIDSEFTKVLGVEWNTEQDSLRLAIGNFPSDRTLTKRALASNIARVYDILGWYSPSVIKVKVLLQQLWTLKIDWDDVVPETIQRTWERWERELPTLNEHHMSRCYFPKSVDVGSIELHGFSDASEVAYGGVVYLRAIHSSKCAYVSLVMAKTKVAPIKPLSMPRLELCGAVIMSRLLRHCSEVLSIPLSATFAWTDSTVVLSWLRGSPRRFKAFVGNRIAEIMELVPPGRWRHVPGVTNSADCASRGLYPSELARHSLWWDGPSWLHGSPSGWPATPELPNKPEPTEEREIQEDLREVNLLAVPLDLPMLEQISSYERLRRVTAWVRRFINNCRANKKNQTLAMGHLTNAELIAAEEYWVASTQQSAFPKEIAVLRGGNEVSSGQLLRLHPFIDGKGLMRAGGRLSHSGETFSKRHPLIMPGKHELTKKIIMSEHLKLLHAGPTLVAASIARRMAITGARRAIRDVTRRCVICRRVAGKPRPQLLGQLPPDRLRPGPIFDRVGVDYAGPILVKSGHVRRPTTTKAYVCVFVSFSVKAVHLEPVSELTTSAFIATLRRFIARRGKPSVIWSDHGTNFVGAARELNELNKFCKGQGTRESIVNFCAERRIDWHFTPENAPHFGGLWEAAVKSFKHHFRRVIGDVRLTFEELATTLAQIEACLNSRPITPMPNPEEGIEALTPGHFLIGAPLEALPDPPASYRPIPLLRRWHLCQTLTRHFWKRWSAEYLNLLQNFSKWRRPTPNFKVGDIVCVRGEQFSPTKWPLARIQEVIPGDDGLVRVVTIRTSKGVYKRPVTKIVPLLSNED